MPTVKFPKSATNPIGYVQVTPDNIDKSKKYPLFIFLHGQGGSGDGSDPDLTSFANGKEYEPGKFYAPELVKELQIKAYAYNFIILAPQTNVGWRKDINHVEKMFSIAAEKNLPVDFTKVYLTGPSLAGEGVWGYPSWSPENARKLAAIVPICCVPGREIGSYCNTANTNVWAFHALKDPTVGVGHTEYAISQIEKCIGHKEVKATYLDMDVHWIWSTVYSRDDLFAWLLSKSTVAPAPLPTVEPFTVTAKVIYDPTLPDFKIEAIEKGGTWVESKWSVLEVPEGVNKYSAIILGGGGWIRGHGKFPKKGKYKFKVEVTDARRRTATAEVEAEYNPDGEVPVKTPRVEIDLRGKTVNGVKVYDDFTWELN